MDGKDITEKELSEISTIIREDNKKQVVLTVERDGTTADITVSLEKVEVTVVKSRMLDDSLGIFRLQNLPWALRNSLRKPTVN